MKAIEHVLYYDTVYYALQGDSNFIQAEDEILNRSATIQVKAVVDDYFIMTVPSFDFLVSN